MYIKAGLLTWVHLLSIFCPGDTSRKVYGFGKLKGFEKMHIKDGESIDEFDLKKGGWNPGAFYPELIKLIEKVEKDKIIPQSKSKRLIEGDISKTSPEFRSKYPGTRFSLLHIEVDLYEPKLSTFENLYPLVSTGGIIVIDEYGLCN